jgi:HSP20 family protein
MAMSWGNQLPVLFANRSAESPIDRLLNDAIHSVNQGSQSWNPACNVFEHKEGFTVQMALPGLDANQIDVQVENNVLRVKGERKQEESERQQWYMHEIGAGAFACSFTLPDYADRDKSTASYKQGLLTITFPKREETKPRAIMIESR